MKCEMKCCNMTCNIGKTDRLLRIIIGLCIIAFGIYDKTWWGAIGIVPLITAYIRWCPAYIPFGLSTNNSKDKSPKE